MLTKLGSGLILAALAGSSLSCGHHREGTPETTLSSARLRSDTLRFAEETRLLAEASGGGSSGGSGSDSEFNPGTFTVPTFKPSTFLVIPAKAATFFAEDFGAPEGFKYQTFTFVSSSCNAQDAFSRYFAAIEGLSGSTLNAEAKDKAFEGFDSIFAGSGVDTAEIRCLLVDLIACIADFTRLNTGVLTQAATSGETTANESPIFTGALSCITEVFGRDIVLPTTSGTNIGASKDPS